MKHTIIETDFAILERIARTDVEKERVDLYVAEQQAFGMKNLSPTWGTVERHCEVRNYNVFHASEHIPLIFQALRTVLYLIEAQALCTSAWEDNQIEPDLYKTMEHLVTVDVGSLLEAREKYGQSWQKRGGVGAFMMLARKYDRIENQVSLSDDIVYMCKKEGSVVDGLRDDIVDLRCYLLLVETRRHQALELLNESGG